MEFNKSMTREDAAHFYFIFLKNAGPGHETWPEVNAAIIRRWSKSGLRYIKERAWKLYEAWRKEEVPT